MNGWNMPPGLSRYLAPVILSVLQAQVGCAQPQQFLLDTVSVGLEGVAWSSVTATTDGGAIADFILELGQDMQWKMDATGEPVWCKQYGISGQRRARMPDGGVVFCEITGHEQNGPRIWLRIVRTDAQGTPIWSRLLTIQDAYGLFFNNAWLYIATDAEGNSLITMSDIGSNAYQWFYCLDADGELLWSRHYLFNPNAQHVEHICSDGFGGWYFGSYDWGASVFRLGHLNVFGDMAWYRSYAVTGPEFWLGGICSMGFQPIAVGGYDAAADDGDYRWFVMRLDLNGNLDWFRISTTTEPMLSRCIASNEGELWVSGGQTGYQSYMARLSGAGDVVSSFRSDTLALNGTEYLTWMSVWDLLDDTLAFGNYLKSVTSGYPPSYQPAIWRLPIADLSACGTQPNELASELAPNNSVAVQDQPFSEAVVPYTLTDTVCTVTSFTPIGVSDYCYYFTGITPAHPGTSSGRVVPTLLMHGEPLMATAGSVRSTIIVHDVRGATLYRGQLAPNGSGSIPTGAWSAGLYFVRIQPLDGSGPNVVKVMVE